MDAFLVSLAFGAGVAGWVYHQVSKRTGHMLGTSWLVAIFVGLAAMFVFYTLFKGILT